MKTEEAQVEELARKLAENGAGYLCRYRRALDRADVILANSQLELLAQPGSPLYEWEHGALPASGRRRVYLATTEASATGEGMTVSFAAVLARSEVEARRNLGSWLGPHLAQGADIKVGANIVPRYGQMFLSPALQLALDEADCGAVAAFSHFAQHHQNRS